MSYLILMDFRDHMAIITLVGLINLLLCYRVGKSQEILLPSNDTRLEDRNSLCILYSIVMPNIPMHLI